MEIRLRAPGSTSNLGPGFDALGLALTVYNRILVRTVSGAHRRMRVTGEGAGQLPVDETNLFFRSADTAARRAGRSLPGLEVEMHNGIPLSRGLGSSSTAIVAGVYAANLLMGEPLSESALLDLATELEGHADNVAPCLLGGLVICSYEDGRVESIRALPPPELRAVVAVPRFELKTEAARAALPEQVPHRDAVFNVGRACLVTAALMSGNLLALKSAMRDRLHQPYRASLVPGIDHVLDAAEEAGALGACLSGAGPTLLAFATDDAPDIAAAMKNAWAQQEIQADTDVLRVDRDGATTE